MKSIKIIQFTAILFCFFTQSIVAQIPNWLWAKSMGGNEHDFSSSIGCDASGNLVIAGWFTGTSDFDPDSRVFNLTSSNSYDGFITKLNAQGNFMWARSTEGWGAEDITSIALDDFGNTYFSGYFSGHIDINTDSAINTSVDAAGWDDFFLVKLDSAGNFIWGKTFGSTGEDHSYGLTIDSSNNLYVVGSFSATVDFDPDSSKTYNLTSAGSDDIFIYKCDSAGNFIWFKSMGSPGGDRAEFIAIDQYSNIYITGTFSIVVDFDPDSSATYNLSSMGAWNTFITKFDSSGEFIWVKSLGEISAFVHVNSIDVDLFGNVYSTGDFQGTNADFDPDPGFNYYVTSNALTQDIFILKLNVSGDFVWVKTIGSGEIDKGNSIAIDNEYNVYVAGDFQGTVDFDPAVGTTNLISSFNSYSRDAFVLKLDTAGGFQMVKQMGGANGEFEESIIIDQTSQVFVTGVFFSPTIQFDSDILTHLGDSIYEDIYVAKLDTSTITGNNEIENFGKYISIYPNPAANYFSISCNLRCKNIEVNISDISGRFIYKKNITASQKVEISTADLLNGIYFVQINSDNFSVIKKVVVLH